MFLPVTLIEDAISSYIDTDLSTINAHEMVYKRPVFWMGENTSDSNAIYILDTYTLSDKITTKNNPLYICNSIPHFFGSDASENLLVLKHGMKLTDVSNCLHQLFDRYEEWYQNLQIKAGESTQLNELLSVSASIFENQINIMNRDFIIVASSTPLDEIYNSLGIPPFNEQGRLDIETVNYFKEDATYNEVKTYQQPFLYPVGYLGTRTLCVNLFWQEEYIARLVVIENKTLFKPWDIYFLAILRDQVQKVYNRFYLNQSENALLNKIFFNMITGREYTHSRLLDALEAKAWAWDDTYCVVYLKPSLQDFHNNTLDYFVVELNEKFNNCCSIRLEKCIIVIVALNNYKNSVSEFVKDFLYFIREGNFRAGYSNPFMDIEHVAEHYKQAKIALQFGSEINPHIWQHHFIDYTLEFILNIATEKIPSQFLCSPGISFLKKFDAEKNSEYLHTLQVYLACNQNAVQCAKELHIQRGTLLYRLDKIKKLTGINLKDPRQLLLIQLSFHMLETKLIETSNESFGIDS